MSEAPKYCAMCPVNASDYAPCKAGVWPDLATNRLPGPQCPFVRLDAEHDKYLQAVADLSVRDTELEEANSENAQLLERYSGVVTQLAEANAEIERLRAEACCFHRMAAELGDPGPFVIMPAKTDKAPLVDYSAESMQKAFSRSHEKGRQALGGEPLSLDNRPNNP